MSLTADGLHSQEKSQTQAWLDLSSEISGPRMPEDFTGLSYEVQQVLDPGFFSSRNVGLIQQFKSLSVSGVLRLGGNTSEFAWCFGLVPGGGVEPPQC